ncbi:MAG: hypothetical protein ACRENG_02435 [bacterium]
MDEEAFRQKFRRSPIKRAKWRGFMRNVLVALGNSGIAEYLPIVARFLPHPEALLQEHARWAYEKLTTKVDGTVMENQMPPPTFAPAPFQEGGKS